MRVRCFSPCAQQKRPRRKSLHRRAPATVRGMDGPEERAARRDRRRLRGLVRRGMADPRGCEYRAIDAARGGQRQPEAGYHDHPDAWLGVARASGDSRRFAVCWNGLVYPVASVGEPANAAAQIRTLLAAPNPWGGDPMHPTRDEELASDKLTILKIPLLLRVGEGELALQAWMQWKAFSGQSLFNEAPAAPNFFLVAGREWIWAKFDRARKAHLRGDPPRRLPIFRIFPAERAKLEALAAKKGIKLRHDSPAVPALRHNARPRVPRPSAPIARR